MKEVRVFAPATIANVGPGFDEYGLALYTHGDIVTARRTKEFEGVRLIKIIGNTDLPYGPENVVEAVGNKVLEASDEHLGIELILEKCMRTETGMGSSAASSSAAAVAVNEHLENPFPRDHPKMLEAVVHGEAVAIKKPVGHPDNVLPSLLGGFIFIRDLEHYEYERFEVGDNLYFVVASPTNIRVNTGLARKALDSAPYDIRGVKELTAKVLHQHLHPELFLREELIDIDSFDLHKLVKKDGSVEVVHTYLRGSKYVIDGIRSNNPRTLGFGTEMDELITPVRAEFIRGYRSVRNAAIGAGAYGFSICGSGPAVFAVTDNEYSARRIGGAMRDAFGRNGVQTEIYISQVNNSGARILGYKA